MSVCVCRCVCACARVDRPVWAPLPVNGVLDSLSIRAQPVPLLPSHLHEHLEADVLHRQLELLVLRIVWVTPFLHRHGNERHDQQRKRSGQDDPTWITWNTFRRFTELVWCIGTYEMLSKHTIPTFWSSWLAQLHQVRSHTSLIWPMSEDESYRVKHDSCRNFQPWRNENGCPILPRRPWIMEDAIRDQGWS